MQIISRKTEKKNDSPKRAEKIEVRTFGGLAILHEGSPITINWESQKARLFLVYW
jgi:hypothetical protein